MEFSIPLSLKHVSSETSKWVMLITCVWEIKLNAYCSTGQVITLTSGGSGND